MVGESSSSGITRSFQFGIVGDREVGAIKDFKDLERAVVRPGDGYCSVSLTGSRDDGAFKIVGKSEEFAMSILVFDEDIGGPFVGLRSFDMDAVGFSRPYQLALGFGVKKDAVFSGA